MEDSPPDNSIELARGIRIRPAALRYQFSRSSGPGGQAVNKISTKAELRVNVSDIQGLDESGRARLREKVGRRLTKKDEVVIHAEASRSQLDNRRTCLAKLCSLVGSASIKPKVRKKKQPTRAMKKRRLEEKKRSSKKKRRRKKPPPEE